MSLFQGFFKGSVRHQIWHRSQKRCKDRLKLTRRRLRNHGYLEETVKEGLEASFSIKSSRWVLKILLWLNCSSLCGGLTASKGGSWQSSVVSGGGGGGWGVRGGFRGRDGGENDFFMLLDVFVACKTRPREIWLTWASWSSSNSPGKIWLALANSALTNFIASVKILYLIHKILYCKYQWSECTELGCRPTTQIWRWSNS